MKSRPSHPQVGRTDGHRGWKRHPAGGLIASGISPRGSTPALGRPGSGTGNAAMRARVYGRFGSGKSVADGPVSTIGPSYMIAMRSHTNFAAPRSSAMHEDASR